MIVQIPTEGKEEEITPAGRTVINMTGKTVPITNTETIIAKVTRKNDNVTLVKRRKYLSRIVMNRT